MQQHELIVIILHASLERIFGRMNDERTGETVDILCSAMGMPPEGAVLSLGREAVRVFAVSRDGTLSNAGDSQSAGIEYNGQSHPAGPSSKGVER